MKTISLLSCRLVFRCVLAVIVAATYVPQSHSKSSRGA